MREEGRKERMNKLYSVQYFHFDSGTSTIVGLFRDENMAERFKNSKNDELKKDVLPSFDYIVRPLYTDF